MTAHSSIKLRRVGGADIKSHILTLQLSSICMWKWYITAAAQHSICCFLNQRLGNSLYWCTENYLISEYTPCAERNVSKWWWPYCITWPVHSIKCEAHSEKLSSLPIQHTCVAGCARPARYLCREISRNSHNLWPSPRLCM